jgi:hypothetical protein
MPNFNSNSDRLAARGQHRDRDGNLLAGWLRAIFRNLDAGTAGGAGELRQAAIGEFDVPWRNELVRGWNPLRQGEFEIGYPAYLLGELRQPGWWYYYLYALAVKTPLGTLALFVLATVFSARRLFSRGFWPGSF